MTDTQTITITRKPRRYVVSEKTIQGVLMHFGEFSLLPCPDPDSPLAAMQARAAAYGRALLDEVQSGRVV